MARVETSRGGKERRSMARFLPRTIVGCRAGEFPGFIEPCLATLSYKAPEGGQWVHEIKFDGYRAQAQLRQHKPTILTRRGYNWTSRFSSIAEALADFPARHIVLDGEVIVPRASGGADFGELQKDLARGDSGRFVYYAFDLLFLDGFDLRGASLRDRKRVLQHLLKEANSPRIAYSEHLETSGPEMLRHACNMGLEGIVSKRIDAPYSSGRNRDWLKTKCVNTEILPIVGFAEAGQSAIGALYLGRIEAGKLVYAGKAGTGFTAESARQLRELLNPLVQDKSPLTDNTKKPHALWVKPEFCAEVHYTEVTSDGRLRHASFKRLREADTEQPSP